MKILFRLVLLGGSMGIGLLCVELSLRLMPHWAAHSVVRVNTVSWRTWHGDLPNLRETIRFRVSSGDLSGGTAGFRPEEDPILTEFEYRTNSIGFRNPDYKSRYDLVALGDSFTGAAQVGKPWAESVGERLGMSTLNLGFPAGASTMQELVAFRTFGIPRKPKVAVLAYFEGNDLLESAEQEWPHLPVLRPHKRFLMYDIPAIFKAWRKGLEVPTAPNPPAHPKSVRITTPGGPIEMVLEAPYVAVMGIPTADILASKNIQTLRRFIGQANAMAKDHGIRFVVVYLPTKPRVYWPWIDRDPILRAKVLADQKTSIAFVSGWLSHMPLDPKSKDFQILPQRLRQHRDDQRQVMEGLMKELHIPFLNLCPTFEERAAQGETLYYPYDTHWNQKGHDLAAEAISNFIAHLNLKTS